MLVGKKGERSMIKKKISKIPKFKTLEEEAKFWDAHSFVDFKDELEEIGVEVDLQRPKEETLVLRLQKDIKKKLEKVAKSSGLNISSLVRLWLIEKLQSSA